MTSDPRFPRQIGPVAPFPGGVVRFLNLSVIDAEERAGILAAIETVLDHGRVVLGPEVEAFEQRMADYCGRSFAVGLNSGTDALILGLRALGIGTGDEVITTPLSWLATGSAIVLNGATAVVGDVDQGLNLDPASIEALITPRTKAILPVHFTGNLARMPEILEIAAEHGLVVIEDGAQAFGATLNGRPCGAFGKIACISLNAMKPLGALGDAGIVLTDEVEIRDRLVMLRHSGVDQREYCKVLSHNCRLDTLQAAVLLYRLDRYAKVIARRRAIAARYDRELASVVRHPPRLDGYEGVYYTYPILTAERDGLQRHLTVCGIETRVQHPVLMNDQPAFQGNIYGNPQRAADLIRGLLCLPIHEKLSEEEVSYVVTSVRQFFGVAS